MDWYVIGTQLVEIISAYVKLCAHVEFFMRAHRAIESQPLCPGIPPYTNESGRKIGFEINLCQDSWMVLKNGKQDDNERKKQDAGDWCVQHNIVICMAHG